MKQQRYVRSLLQPTGRSLPLLTGQRRVGKTFLLTHTWEADNYFLFTAARTSPEINRRQLIQDLSQFAKRNLHEADYPTWRSVFNLMLDLRLERPLAIVLDEFQYLATDTAGLAQITSELNAAWERPREPQPLLIVLAGSAVSTLGALDTGGTPLFGRFDWRHKLLPFNYWYADQVAPFNNLRDRVAAFGVFGGMPKYLGAIDTTRSLDENIAALHLAPGGLVRQLLETAVAQEEGLRDVASYNAILRVIAGGATTRNEIAQQAGLPNNTAFIARLEALQNFGWISERKNIGRGKTQAIQYALNDAAMRFHYRFVEPHASILAREDPLTVWEKLKIQLLAYLGLEFEGVVQEAYTRPASRRRGAQLGTRCVTAEFAAPVRIGFGVHRRIPRDNRERTQPTRVRVGRSGFVSRRLRLRFDELFQLWRGKVRTKRRPAWL